MANVVFASGAYTGALALPLFLIARAVGDVVGLLPAFRVLIVWVHDRTGSLLVAMLMHVSLTASTIIFEPVGISGTDLVIYDVASVLAWWAVVATVARALPGAPVRRRHRGDHVPAAWRPRSMGDDPWRRHQEPAARPPAWRAGLSRRRAFSATSTRRSRRSSRVVYWEQRGSGKSFHRGIPRSSMTVERFITDLDELVDAVRARLGHDRVTIFGHSWGSALGVLYAARFPGKVAAYVGSGQIGDWAEGEGLSYAYALAEAERLDNGKALEELRAIGPPPHTADRLWVERTWLQRLEGNFSARSLWKMARVFFGGAETSVFELPRIMRGFRISIDAMWAEVSRLNLLTLAPTLRVPVFFFLGRRDHWVPPEASVAYFDALTAPSKQIVWFEASGHEPFADEPVKFNKAMAELVRPGLG